MVGGLGWWPWLFDLENKVGRRPREEEREKERKGERKRGMEERGILWLWRERGGWKKEKRKEKERKKVKNHKCKLVN